MQTTCSNALYTDGGLMSPNPSTVGGTWAWIRVQDGEEVARKVGLLLPDEINLPAVSNNNTELYALLQGIASLPDNWQGTVYSDSLFAIGVVFRQFKVDSVPNYLRLQLSKVLGKAMERNLIMENVLLAGHPSRKDLAAGIRLSKSPHLPVSHWNVACDEACTRRGGQYLRVLAHREARREAAHA